jgi:hypothetical protein
MKSYHDYYNEELRDEYMGLCEQYEDMDSGDLLDMIVSAGPSLNHEKFPAFDVAKELKEHNWTPTPKQHNALAHSLAHYEVFD